MTAEPNVPGAVCLSDPDHDLTAAFVPSAGMIGVSLRHRGEELLGQRRGFEAYRTAGKTMGIPFLHPWANRLGERRYEVDGVVVELPEGAAGVRVDPNGLPIHGLLAAAPDWEVSTATDERLVASLDLEARPDLLRSFPFPHRVQLAITLADARLTIETTVVPTGNRRVPLAFGFHPYLTLPGVPREAWRIELPTMRHRSVDDHGLPTGEVEPAPAAAFPLADRTFDDGYDEVPVGAAFVLEGGGRRITTRLDAGYPAAQVYAPAGEALICFEPMAAPTNALGTGRGLRFVNPGETASSVFSIEVRASSAAG